MNKYLKIILITISVIIIVLVFAGVIIIKYGVIRMGGNKVTFNENDNLHAESLAILPIGVDDLLLKRNMDNSKIKVFCFWASWCKPCHLEIPMLYNKISGDSNYSLTLISGDRFNNRQVKETKLHLAKMGVADTTYIMDFPVGLDFTNAGNINEFVKHFTGSINSNVGMPCLVVFNKNNDLIHQFAGFPQDSIIASNLLDSLILIDKY